MGLRARCPDHGGAGRLAAAGGYVGLDPRRARRYKAGMSEPTDRLAETALRALAVPPEQRQSGLKMLEDMVQVSHPGRAAMIEAIMNCPRRSRYVEQLTTPCRIQVPAYRFAHP